MNIGTCIDYIVYVSQLRCSKNACFEKIDVFYSMQASFLPPTLISVDGEDYQVTTSTVTLMAGQQVFTPTLSIPIIDDVVPENVEVFVVDLIIPREIALCRGTHGENTSIEVTIHDDDGE